MLHALKPAQRARWGVIGLVVTVLVSLAACSGDKPKATPLEALGEARLAARVQWTVRTDRINFPMAASANDGRVAIASSRGEVIVLRADTGAEEWRGNAQGAVVAGVGFDGTRAAVVTRDNELVVMDKGGVKWRAVLRTQVTSPPLVAGERVFVLTVDRVVHAYDALDGKYIWTLQRPGESLGLVSAGVLAPFRDVLLVGQGPRLTAVDSLRGTVNYDVPLASPRGTNEIERLADLVGPIARVGDVVCARAFQSAVGCVQAERGALVWSKNVSGRSAVAADADMVVAADSSDRVQAWRTRNGDTLWNHERLLHRGLSGAALVPKAVIFGDQQGYLHFFDRSTGNTLQRLPGDGTAVVGAPLVVGRTVVVVHRSGTVTGITVD